MSYLPSVRRHGCPFPHPMQVAVVTGKEAGTGAHLSASSGFYSSGLTSSTASEKYTARTSGNSAIRVDGVPLPGSAL